MRIFTCVALLCLVCGVANAANYYVDSRTGNDRNSGLSPQKPWRTIEKVNGGEFAAGDSILFRRGSVWTTGTALKPSGSGVAGKPIVISAYGKGYLPLIAGQGFTGSGVITLHNQSWWVISDLELTNWAEEPGDRRGIEVKGANGGLLQGIHIKGMVIHHIKGIIGQGRKEKRTAGVEFIVTHDNNVPTRFDDLLVDGCHIYDIENQGIVLNNEQYENKKYPGDETWERRMFTNVTISNNVIHDISKNAMIIRMTEGGVVEHNVCFRTSYMEHGGNTIFSRNVRGTVFQYNEGFQNRSPDHDGSLYDPDINSPGTIWQYSYSHDNAHGLAWFCTDHRDDQMHVRDNVSEDDHGYLVYFNYAFTSAYVYRNMFYCGPYVSPFFMNENRKNLHKFFSYTGNIVYNDSADLKFEYPYEGNINPGSQKQVDNNLFLGNPPVGNYRNELPDISGFKPFHRGFAKAGNMLDGIVGNKHRQFTCCGDNGEKAVGSIAGVPVYAHELEREFIRNRWRFARANGGVDNKEAYNAAVDALVLIKVQQAEMNARTIPQAAGLNAVNSLLEMENDLRRNVSREEVMWFGPQRYERGPFWLTMFADAQEQLRKSMVNDTLDYDEAELRAHFEQEHQPAWKKRGYDYQIRAIRTSLIDKKYDEYFNAKAVEAEVAIDKGVERTFIGK